jgi:hypothetical protein
MRCRTAGETNQRAKENYFAHRGFPLKTRWPTEPMKIVLVEDKIIGSHVGRNVKYECLMRDQSGVIEFPNGSDSLDKAGQDVLAKLRRLPLLQSKLFSMRWE